MVTLLDDKWKVVKDRLTILSSLPRIEEYIYVDNTYYVVLNIVHRINKKHDIFIIVKEASIKVKNITIGNQ